ncbi:MAG: diguanylate cyclase [Sneathiellaceae bacterium]
MAVPERILERIEALRGLAREAGSPLAEEVAWLCDSYLKLENNMQKLSRVSDRMQSQIMTLNDRLAAAAVTDTLTGLANRRGTMERLAVLEQDAESSGFAVMLADIDRFKAINDNHGHEVGDMALVEVARRLSVTLGDAGMIGRWGGEEFLAVLPVPDRDTAQGWIERLHDALRGAPIDSPEGPLAVRISSGACWHRPGRALMQTILYADRALYASKEAGRDCGLWWEEAGQAGGRA